MEKAKFYYLVLKQTAYPETNLLFFSELPVPSSILYIVFCFSHSTCYKFKQDEIAETIPLNKKLCIIKGVYVCVHT